MATIAGTQCTVGRYKTIEDICTRYADADAVLIDIPIGLPETAQEASDRPERLLRSALGKKARSVFPVPFRQQVYALSRATAWELNRLLHAKQTPMSMAICPAIRQVDAWLQRNPEWKNRLCESHPEYVFLLLHDHVPLLHQKNTPEGVSERISILRTYVANVEEVVQAYCTTYRTTKNDDVLDALCLAVIGQEGLHHGFVTIPEVPQKDASGLYMHIVVGNTKNPVH
ncbi:MAG: DUF429 domain-containing protein [Paenibacillaceae bacterium]|nr:DUF429 domain-containing protein [Paenibacillaceae bacterium]